MRFSSNPFLLFVDRGNQLEEQSLVIVPLFCLIPIHVHLSDAVVVTRPYKKEFIGQKIASRSRSPSIWVSSSFVAMMP